MRLLELCQSTNNVSSYIDKITKKLEGDMGDQLNILLVSFQDIVKAAVWCIKGGGG